MAPCTCTGFNSPDLPGPTALSRSQLRNNTALGHIMGELTQELRRMAQGLPVTDTKAHEIAKKSLENPRQGYWHSDCYDKSN